MGNHGFHSDLADGAAQSLSAAWTAKQRSYRQRNRQQTANRETGKMLTETQIKATIRNAPTSGKKSIALKDGGERGAGRLALLIRPFAGRVTAEWYAIWYRDGKRVSVKISSYPILSLADARRKFREEYAPAISTGAEPTA